MTVPVIAPPEAQPSASSDFSQGASESETRPSPSRSTESMARPFRLGLVGFGAAVGLFVRLLAANNFGDLDSRSAMLGSALTSVLMGVGLLLMASERDRFGSPLAWISAITALAWAVLNWISPPFAASVTVWSNPDQLILAVLGLGNGLLLAGIVSLAFVRRHPTLSVGTTLVGSVFALAANTLLLRDEWPAIVSLGIAFALILLAWDQSPRQELAYTRPEASPRVSRAALSFISVALCGTAIQLWTSRTDIPRSIPAVIVCAVLIVGAFVTLVGVRREIEKRETTLSEWTSWAREIRTNDFRAEMQNFESGTADLDTEPQPHRGHDGEAPRKLSFPNLSIPDTPETPVTAALPATIAARIDPDTPPMFADSLGAAEDSGVTADDSIVAPGAVPHLVVPELVLPELVTPALPSQALLTPDLAPSPESVLEASAQEATVAAAPVAQQPASLALPRIDSAPALRAPAAPDETPIVTTPVVEPDQAGGVFSALLSGDTPPQSTGVQLADLDTLGGWLSSPVAAARTKPLLVAIEAMDLGEFESLPPLDAAMATQEIGSFLADTMPDADLVSWIDGPYFIVAHASKPDADLGALNKSIRKSLKGTNGVLAFLRPGPNASLDDMVNDAVSGLLQARLAEERASGR